MAESAERDLDGLIERAVGGDESAMAELFERYRKRLGQVVRLRLDRRLQGRVDPSDVLQEAYLDLAQKLPSYAERRGDQSMPFFLWLRLVLGERLIRIHRHHLGAAMRDAGREVSIHQGGLPKADSTSLAARLLGRFTSVSQAVARAEMRGRIQEVLDGMAPLDREVIALRHFEELSNDEVATVLGLSTSAASKRYLRAITRLKSAVEEKDKDFL